MNEENKNDLKKFRNLQNQLSELWKTIENDDINLFSGENKETFINALNDATEFVSGISKYYDEIEKIDLFCNDCDYSNLKDKNTKKIIKEKKFYLDDTARLIDNLYEKPILTTLFLEVTLRCNARCEHCGSSCGNKIPDDEISAEHLKKALLNIHEKYGAPNVFLMVTGGEPLIRKDLFDIMEYAIGLGYHWGVATNGMLINERMIDKFRKSNMESIAISLDGLKETHEKFRRVPGSFDKVMNAIELMKKLECLKHMQISTVANKKNVSELEDMYNLLLEKGIKEWKIITVDPIGRAYSNDGLLLNKEEFTYVLDFIKKKRLEGKINVTYSCGHYLGLKYENTVRDDSFKCGAGLYIGSILSNGDICVCPSVREKSLIQGNIKNDLFTDIWENKFKEFRKKRITKNEKCLKCKSYKYCRGDSFHTWDFDNKKPNMCMKDILLDEFIE